MISFVVGWVFTGVLVLVTTVLIIWVAQDVWKEIRRNKDSCQDK